MKVKATCTGVIQVTKSFGDSEVQETRKQDEVVRVRKRERESERLRVSDQTFPRYIKFH